MRFYCIFKCLLIAAFTLFSVNLMAQSADSLRVTTTLVKGNSQYVVISNNGGNIYYGTNGAKINATLDGIYWPSIRDNQSVFATIYRVHNGNPTIIKDVVEENTQITNLDVFTPDPGVNQSIKYRIVFTINEDGQEPQHIPNDGTFIESKEISFSIYDSEGYTISFTKQPNVAERNTFAGRTGKPIEYAAKVKPEEGKVLPPFQIVWTNDTDTELKGTTENEGTYSFNPPSTLDAKTEYTFTATVVFLNPGDTTQEWFKGTNTKSTEYPLVVYPKMPDIDSPEKYLVYPEDLKGNATHQGKTNAYTYTLSNIDNEDNKYGELRYVWSGLKKEDETSNSYTFTPSKEETGEHTVKVTVTCVNPDDNTDEWYTVLSQDYDTLTIYRNPTEITNAISQYIHYPIPVEGKNSVKTYVGRKDEGSDVPYVYEYYVNIKDSVEYGRWIYTWKRNNDVLNPEKPFNASFIPSQSGEYKTTLSIKCVNPNDEGETWVEIEESNISIPVLKVFEDPNLLKIEDYIISPKEEELVDYENNSNFSPKTYRVKLPDNAGDFGTWIYNWVRNEIVVSQEDNANISKSLGKGDYKTSLELTCVNPDNVDDVWRSFSKEFVVYKVYPEPSCGMADYHFRDKDKGETVYAMYVNQTLDTRNLISFEGGCRDENAWEVDLYVNDDKQDSHVFVPTQKTDNPLNLSLVAKNYVTLPSSHKKYLLWEGDSIQYKVYVYEDPCDNIKIKIGNEEPANIYTDIDVINDQLITFISEETSFDWELKSGNDVITTANGKPTFKWKGERKNENSDESSDYTLTCKINENSLPDCFYAMGPPSETIRISVWKEMGIKVDNLEDYPKNGEYYVLETCQGEERISVTATGGKYNKWKETLEWIPEEDNQLSPDAKKISYTKKYENIFKDLKANNDGTPGIYKYKVSTSYQRNSDKSDLYERNILIKVWPKPKVEKVMARLENNDRNPQSITYEIEPYNGDNSYKVEGNCYSGDVILMQCELTGGMTGDEQGWEYTAIKRFDISNSETINGDIVNGQISFPFTGNYSYTAIKPSYKYKGIYYTSKKEWLDDNEDLYYLYFTVYPLPESTPNLTDSVVNGTPVVWGNDVVDVYAGGMERNNVNFEFNTSKGYFDGWSYEWMVDDQRQSEDKNQWIYTPTTATGNPYEHKTIKVHVVNSLPDGNKGLDTTYVYPIKVWHKAEFKDFILKDETQAGRVMTGDGNFLAIRDGNKISGAVDAIQHGYSSKYSYKWSGEHVQEDNLTWNEEVHYGNSDNPTKAHETLTYTLRMENMGPYGNVWDGVTYSHHVEVYKKPDTPTSLVQKGKGTSCTMIATSSVSDDDLDAREYYLVFGYTDENGIDHIFESIKQEKPGNVRWNSQFKGILDETQRKYAMEHAYVFALWKYGSNPSDPFPAQITSGKCMLTGIDEAYDSSTYDGISRAILGDDDVDAIEAIYSGEEIRNVYNLNGVRVGSTLSNLKPGLYVVEFTNGVTNKITLK